MGSEVTRLRTGSALAAAAVVVALPRHLVAQLHQAGYPSPAGPVWPVVVIGSAVAWAGLEAGTMFYLWSAYSQTRRRHLLVLMFAILGAIAATNAPSLVADSAGLTLTALVGVASIAHWSWAIASIAATLLVVVAAGAADAATIATQQRIDALVDAIDAGREPVQAVAAQQVTVNVSQTSPPDATGSDSRHVESVLRTSAQSDTERAVEVALLDGAHTSVEIAEAVGITPGAVRQTLAWRMRRKAVSA